MILPVPLNGPQIFLVFHRNPICGTLEIYPPVIQKRARHETTDIYRSGHRKKEFYIY